MTPENAFEMATANIRFGTGVTREIGMDLADLGVRRVMVLADPNLSHLQPVAKPNRIDLELIRGVDRVRDILHDNTRRFAERFPANNVLLWGARGMGKSSLVKAVHAAIVADLDALRPRFADGHLPEVDAQGNDGDLGRGGRDAGPGREHP